MRIGLEPVSFCDYFQLQTHFYKDGKMRRRVERRRRNQRFSRFLSELIVGGVILFQGTGFITNPTYADDPVSRNRDVTTLVGTTNLSDPAYNYGLYGSPLTQTVNVYGGVNAVIGKLTADSKSLNPAEPVSMTMSSGSAIRIGLNDAGESSSGSLYVSGPWGGSSNSTLNASSGSSIQVGNDGSLFVGYNKTGQKGLGILGIDPGASISNNGTDSADLSGVVILTGSQIRFGTNDDTKVLTDFYTGSGALRNFGTVNVFNGTDGSDAFSVSNYIDHNSEYGNGTLKVTGDARLGSASPTMSLYGTVDIGGNLDFNSASEINLINSGSVSASSMTVGDNLTINNTDNGKFTLSEINLSGGLLKNSGNYSFHEMNLSDGSLSGSYTGTSKTVKEGEKEEVIQPKVNVTGIIDLDGTTEFKRGTGSGQLELTISGNGAFDGGDYDVAFTDTAVNNAGSLATSALSAKNITFSGNSDYVYSGTGVNNLNGNVNFDKDASLTVSADDPLTISAGKTLTMGSEGNHSTLIFDIHNADEPPLITLASSGDSSAAAKVYADAQISNTDKKYIPGSYEVTLIKTSNADSVYDINLSESELKNTLFVTRQGRVSEDKTSYVLDINNKGFSSSAETTNQKNAAGYIDKTLKTPDLISDDLKDFFTDVMDLDADTDSQVVARVLDAVSGANRANALMLAMSDPWQYSFNQLGWQTHRAYTPECEPCRTTVRGQAEYYEEGYYDGETMYGGYPSGSVFGYNQSIPNSVWAAAHTTSFNARNDDNCDEYGITNTGISFGYDTINSSDSTLGLAFDYSQPFLYSSWKDVRQHIDQSNFNLGLYGRRDYYNGFSITGYAGFGLQHMTSKRDVAMAEIDPDLAIDDIHGTGNRYRSGSNGHSFAAAIKLARDLPAYGWFILRPMVQFDTQSVWIDSGSENGNAIALKYDKTDWNRTFVRAGFETEKNSQFCRLTSRFLYAQQLGGDSAPEMTASFVGDSTGNVMKIYGVDLGEKYFDAGVGVLGYLDCAYQWAISGNYDFATSEKSTAHIGTVALSYSF